MKTLIRKIALITFFASTTLVCHADPSEEDNLENVEGSEEQVPIDGGVSLLIAAGVGYGVKKMRDQRKERAKMDI